MIKIISASSASHLNNHRVCSAPQNFQGYAAITKELKPNTDFAEDLVKSILKDKNLNSLLRLTTIDKIEKGKFNENFEFNNSQENGYVLKVKHQNNTQYDLCLYSTRRNNKFNQPTIVRYKKTNGEIQLSEIIKPICSNNEVLGLELQKIDPLTMEVIEKVTYTPIKSHIINSSGVPDQLLPIQYGFLRVGNTPPIFCNEQFLSLMSKACISTKVKDYQYNELPGVEYTIDENIVNSYFLTDNGVREIDLNKLNEEIPYTNGGLFNTSYYFGDVINFVSKCLNINSPFDNNDYIIGKKFNDLNLCNLKTEDKGMNRVVLEFLDKNKGKSVNLYEFYEELNQFIFEHIYKRK